MSNVDFKSPFNQKKQTALTFNHGSVLEEGLYALWKTFGMFFRSWNIHNSNISEVLNPFMSQSKAVFPNEETETIDTVEFYLDT